MDETRWAVLICIVVGLAFFMAGYLIADYINKKIYAEAQHYKKLADIKFDEAREMCKGAKTRLDDIMKRNAELYELVIHLTQARDEPELNKKPEDDLLGYMEEHLEENGL